MKDRVSYQADMAQMTFIQLAMALDMDALVSIQQDMDLDLAPTIPLTLGLDLPSQLVMDLVQNGLILLHLNLVTHLDQAGIIPQVKDLALCM